MQASNSHKNKLTSSPTLVSKSWTHPKVAKLLEALVAARVASRKALCEKCQEDKAFLLPMLLRWYQPGCHNEIVRSWPAAS